MHLSLGTFFFYRIRQGLEIGIVERIKLDLEWTIKP